MNSIFIEKFYVMSGYTYAYSSYPILLLFILKSTRILHKPFNYIFINILISVIFDLIILRLHENKSDVSYFTVIVALYAINNLIFLGLFLSFYLDNPLKKYVSLSSYFFSILIIILYYQNSKTWSA